MQGTREQGNGKTGIEGTKGRGVARSRQRTVAWLNTHEMSMRRKAEIIGKLPGFYLLSIFRGLQAVGGGEGIDGKAGTKGPREQGTGNREQGTGNREQGTGNREGTIIGFFRPLTRALFCKRAGTKPPQRAKTARRGPRQETIRQQRRSMHCSCRFCTLAVRPSVSTSRHIGTNPVSVSDLAI
jgi:hypothetical protein